MKYVLQDTTSDEGAAGGGDWRAGIPEDIRGSPALKDIKDPGALARSFLEAQSMLGNSVRLPSKEGGEEARKAFRTRMLEVGKDYGVMPMPGVEEDDTPVLRALGAPEKGTDYEVPEITSASGLKFDDAEIAVFREAATASGLTKKQFKKVVESMAKAREPAAVAAQQKFEEGHTALKGEWGQAYDQRLATVEKLLEANQAPESLRQAAKDKRIDAASAKWLYTLLNEFGDTTELTTQGKRAGTGVLTPLEAIARVEEVEKRMGKLNPGDPEYDMLMKRRVELIGIANPQ